MPEFEEIQEIKPNNEILGLLTNYTYTIKIGRIRHLIHTNLQFIQPTEYLITYPTTITILENKLRLAICMCDNYSHTNLEYDKKEMYKYFDSLLKEINSEYRTTTINFAKYPYIIFVSSKIMEMDSSEQNKAALYLFNSINFKIKNCKSIDNKEQMF